MDNWMSKFDSHKERKKQSFTESKAWWLILYVNLAQDIKIEMDNEIEILKKSQSKMKMSTKAQLVKEQT